MARPRTTKPPLGTVRSLTVRVAPDVHRDIRLRAASEGMTIEEVCRGILYAAVGRDDLPVVGTHHTQPARH